MILWTMSSVVRLFPLSMVLKIPLSLGSWEVVEHTRIHQDHHLTLKLTHECKWLCCDTYFTSSQTSEQEVFFPLTE